MVWKKIKSPEKIIKKGKDIQLSEKEQRLTERDKPNLKEISGLFKHARVREVKVIEVGREKFGRGIWKEKFK